MKNNNNLHIVPQSVIDKAKEDKGDYASNLNKRAKRHVNNKKRMKSELGKLSTSK